MDVSVCISTMVFRTSSLRDTIFRAEVRSFQVAADAAADAAAADAAAAAAAASVADFFFSFFEGKFAASSPQDK